MTLEILTSDALVPIRHGFFTRRGGASSGIFEGLNCGLGSSDQSEAVRINRARAAEAMGAHPEALRSLHQVHSARAVQASVGPPLTPPEADAIVTATPGLVLAVLTADCAPVLLADARAQVIGAVHAGWRGALDGVLESALTEMAALGANTADITAVIGPTISQAAYEVGPEFFDRFRDDDPENTRFFIGGMGDRLHFDLPGFALMRLRKAGVGAAEWTRHCTFSDPARFFSYRRSVLEKQADYGRLIATIAL